MTLAPPIDTHSRSLVVCAECEREVVYLVRNEHGKAIIRPCGHKASMKLVPNPRLRQA